MKEILLQRKTKQGLLKAVYAPEIGLNLTSLTLDGCEIIDQNTYSLFQERASGLGPLIGPHFYHRNKDEIPTLIDKTLFKHTSKKDYPEPLSHGIGRYVPWNFDASDMSLRGHLSGTDSYKDNTLASLEGFDFKLDYHAHLTDEGINIDYSVMSPTHPCIVGLHYYLNCDPNSHVQLDSDLNYGSMGVMKPIQKSWVNPDFNGVDFKLNQEADYTFRKENEKNEGTATLFNQNYNLTISYKASSREHAFQLYHPKGESFVCIEPVTAKNPRQANQLKSKISIKFKIELNK